MKFFTKAKVWGPRKRLLVLSFFGVSARVLGLFMLLTAQFLDVWSLAFKCLTSPILIGYCKSCKNVVVTLAPYNVSSAVFLFLGASSSTPTVCAPLASPHLHYVHVKQLFLLELLWCFSPKNTTEFWSPCRLSHFSTACAPFLHSPQIFCILVVFPLALHYE